MRYALFALAALGLLLVGACSDESLGAAWQIEGPRILAVRAAPPLCAPGDTVELTVLLAGVDPATRSATPVSWKLGNEVRSLPADRAARFVVPQESALEGFFGATVAADYIRTGRAVVEASVTLRRGDGREMTARKELLVAKSSIVTKLQYAPPAIDRILVEIPGENGLSLAPGMTVMLPAAGETATIDISVELADNDAIADYGYAWFVEGYGGDRYPRIERGANLAKMRLSLPRWGTILVHLVVEDRSFETGDPLFTGGVDFISFPVAFGSALPDDDVVDEDNSDADELLND